jgi:hypothetical protein
MIGLEQRTAGLLFATPWVSQHSTPEDATRRTRKWGGSWGGLSPLWDPQPLQQ